MCGVIGLTSEHHRTDLGAVAAELLKTLEYRGYDSTGAAVQAEGETIVLRKGVGAPSVMVEKLGITGLAGSIMCGQVRWATFGSVDDLNAQPHQVHCHTHIYGAHNGNVTNCDDLKSWLTSLGHEVVSDNDGEMVVHTVEHFFAEEIEARGGPQALSSDDRRAAMRAAIATAGQRLHGSYAAVVVDPVSRTLWAIKEGSSLYFGFGHDDRAGDFALASSDLSSVLKMTRILVPMSEGEFIEYTPSAWQLHTIREQGSNDAATPIERQPVRSRLQARDAALLPEHAYYMEQEIAAQEETCKRIASLFRGGSKACSQLSPVIDQWSADDRAAIDAAIANLGYEYRDEAIQTRFHELVELPAWRRLVDETPPTLRTMLLESSGDGSARDFTSQESGLLSDLLMMAETDEEHLSVHLLDILAEREEVARFLEAANAFIESCNRSITNGGRILVVCCGSSYHAAMAGAVFFNEIARTQIHPVLPGEFRARFAHSLRPEDVVVAVSQSGETKDLVDVMNQIIETGLPIRRIAIVNNVSSTLGQEKCELVLPLRCGPEISVPATKSYMNQLAMLYALAIRLGHARIEEIDLDPDQKRAWSEELERRFAGLDDLSVLIRKTLASSEESVEEATELLYLAPSMHILATRFLAIAKEGALKIREVVLNHTEGYEGSEFKHGPNTILGFNTIFGLDGVMRAVEKVRDAAAAGVTLRPDEILAVLYHDYPLIFVTSPDERDVNLTVSQVNTHKIRGTSCVMVAEENAALRQAVMKPPTDNPHYRSVYLPLPVTSDPLMVIFSATVVLQRLALRMSVRKMEALERLGIRNHGVHPDVPKNVSKSITVD